MSISDKLIIDNLTKMYDKRHGIKSISTVINAGEIVCFVGPNGVGKTTLVKSAAGLLRASEGKVLLQGIDTSSRECKSQIGYMQNDLSFYEKMTVYEILDFICKVKYDGKFREEINFYLKKYGLFEQRNAHIRKLSLGMQRKLSIIMALLGTPKLILFDEPTNGVDTAGIIQLKNDLHRCAKEGSIILITSHVLDFVEKICTRCVFLKDGRIARDLSLQESDVCLEDVYEEIYVL